MTEDEMDGWHHRCNGHEFERALGDGEGQGSLAHCSPRGRKESDTTGRLNSNKLTVISKENLQLTCKRQSEKESERIHGGMSSNHKGREEEGKGEEQRNHKVVRKQAPHTYIFSSAQSLSHVRLFATLWTAARQASPSITISWSLLKLMSPLSR